MRVNKYKLISGKVLNQNTNQTFGLKLPMFKSLSTPIGFRIKRECKKDNLFGETSILARNDTIIIYLFEMLKINHLIITGKNYFEVLVYLA